MKYVEFDETRPMDLVLLGRVAIDFNPAYNDQVKEEFKPLKKVHMFEKFVGGSPANIAVGVTRHGLKAGFFAKVSDDQFGEFVVDYFNEQGIDTSHISKCTNGEKLGLTFTEMLSPKESSILMYRNCIADLQLSVDDIDDEYIKQTKAILISGTALAESPSREAAIKAVMLAKKNNTKETNKKTEQNMWQKAAEKAATDSLSSAGIVFLITGAGGAFSNIITITGVSDAISDIVSGLTTNVFVVIILAYLVGLLIKQVTGSGTVSAITSMTIMSSVAPAVALPPVFIAMACLSGTLFGATVNDSGFWIVTNMSGLEFTGGVKTYTIPEMIESVVYLVIILLITAGYVMIF